MSSRSKLLKAVFQHPIRANIHWDDVERLIKVLGGEVSYGGGSSVIFVLNGIRMVFHSPHPQNETSKGAIRRLCQYLEDAGFKPDGV